MSAPCCYLTGCDVIGAAPSKLELDPQRPSFLFVALPVGVALVGISTTVALVATAKWGWAIAFFIITPVAAAGAAVASMAIAGKRL